MLINIKDEGKYCVRLNTGETLMHVVSFDTETKDLILEVEVEVMTKKKGIGTGRSMVRALGDWVNHLECYDVVTGERVKSRDEQINEIIN